MIEVNFYNTLEKGNGWSFNLLPIINIDNVIYENRTEKSIFLGVWFWYCDISWVKEK